MASISKPILRFFITHENYLKKLRNWIITNPYLLWINEDDIDNKVMKITGERTAL